MDLCLPCRGDLPWLQHACRHCALPLPPGDKNSSCGHCQSDVTATDCCHVALLYDYPVDRLVGALKFERRLQLARTLGELLIMRLAADIDAARLKLPDLILPVPLHSKRLIVRGYNQSEEIAVWVAKHFGLKLRRNLAVRVKPTLAQTGLTRRARLENVRGAFTLNENLTGLRVAIIDDVITTGSTTAQLAKLCKKNGAEEVQVWAIARTPS